MRHKTSRGIVMRILLTSFFLELAGVVWASVFTHPLMLFSAHPVRASGFSISRPHVFPKLPNKQGLMADAHAMQWVKC
jgi:hypothetical protein